MGTDDSSADSIDRKEVLRAINDPQITSWGQASAITPHKKRDFKKAAAREKLSEKGAQKFLKRRRAKKKRALAQIVESMQLLALEHGKIPSCAFVRRTNPELCALIYKHFRRSGMKGAWLKAGLSPNAGDPLPKWLTKNRSRH